MIVRILTAIIYGSIKERQTTSDGIKCLGRSQLNGTVYLCFGHNAHEYSRDVYKFNPEEFRFIPLNTLLPDRYPGITRSYASF